jgi:hypothetical protein
MSRKEWIEAFIAGAVAVLVFHQFGAALVYLFGWSPRAPWSLAPTAPLGIPQVVSQAFWGGVWAMALWPALRKRATQADYWWGSLLIGMCCLSLAGWFVAQPLKGQPVAFGWDALAMLRSLLLNGAWGLGLALLMRLRRRGVAARIGG